MHSHRIGKWKRMCDEKQFLHNYQLIIYLPILQPAQIPVGCTFHCDLRVKMRFWFVKNMIIVSGITNGEPITEKT